MRRRRATLAAALIGGALLGVLAVRAFSGRDEPRIDAVLSLASAMAADTSGFARATTVRPFAFPVDHGPHPDFATEWWYFTGNVRTADGRVFGYQLTFFRKALAPAGPPRASAWSADHAYMAHFALTDVRGEAFHAFDRFARSALGLAGAQAEPLRVWLHDWSALAVDHEVEAAGRSGVGTAGRTGAAARATGTQTRIDSTAAAFPLRLVAADGDVAIDLLLERGKQPVLQGQDGLSRKGPEAGNASYYYSLPRMPTRGTVQIGGARFEVSGTSWMDREWSTSGLSPDVVGWDWFALQLDDTTELMLYRLRRADGSATSFSGGSFVDPDGTVRALAADDATVDVLDVWTSPHTDTEYPARWRVRVPAAGLDVTVTPTIRDQELRLAVRYWEGAVRVDGERGGRRVSGVGYVELTGYGDAQPDGSVRGR
jgi:predicted secreted hydrolase